MIKSYPDAANKLRASPVEVKSGKRYTTVSLDKFKRKFGKKVGVEYVLHPKDFRKEGNRMSAPLYMTMRL